MLPVGTAGSGPGAVTDVGSSTRHLTSGLWGVTWLLQQQQQQQHIMPEISVETNSGVCEYIRVYINECLYSYILKCTFIHRYKHIHIPIKTHIHPHSGFDTRILTIGEIETSGRPDGRRFYLEKNKKIIHICNERIKSKVRKEETLRQTT